MTTETPLEIVKQDREFEFKKAEAERERKFQADKLFFERTSNTRENASNTSINYGSQTIKFCFQLNGGAIILLVTYLGVIQTKLSAQVSIKLDDFFIPFFAFALGLIFAVVGSASGYFNFICVRLSMPKNNDLWDWINDNKVNNISIKSGMIMATYISGITSVMLSIALFLFGAYKCGSFFVRP